MVLLTPDLYYTARANDTSPSVVVGYHRTLAILHEQLYAPTVTYTIRWQWNGYTVTNVQFIK